MNGVKRWLGFVNFLAEKILYTGNWILKHFLWEFLHKEPGALGCFSIHARAHTAMLAVSHTRPGFH